MFLNYFNVTGVDTLLRAIRQDSHKINSQFYLIQYYPRKKHTYSIHVLNRLLF